MAWSNSHEHDGVTIAFVRRRYNGHKTFTWLWYRDNANKWHEYGDPWPSVIIPRQQLNLAVADIKANKITAAKDGQP